MKGWKTWVGAVLIGVSAALEAAGLGEWAKVAATIGTAFGIVGLGHKVEKAANSAKK